MLVAKLKQFRYESDAWKRLLAFMSEENIRLKNRLSEVLKDGFDDELLIKAEDFQTHFVKEDDLIRLLRNDIAELDKILVKDLSVDGSILKSVERKFESIRNSISIAEKQFGHLKCEFSKYLLQSG
jgi:hypothetical protein